MSRGAAVAVGIAMTVLGTGVQAASEVDVGGFQDRVLENTQEHLLGLSPSTSNLGTHLQVRTTSEPSSALTGFTPRLGGLGLAISGRRHSEGSLLVEDKNAPPDRLQIGLSDTAEIAGWDVGLAATADMGQPDTAGDVGSSALVVGGQLAVSGLRFDAAVGRDRALLGEDGRRMTAGVGYDFGRLDTRMSYSLVQSENRTAETGLLTLGSSLALTPGVSLKGDLAIADENGRDSTTAGRVSLRLNF